MARFGFLKRIVGVVARVGEHRGPRRVRATLGARVLVVDDSATIRAVLGKILGQDGYEVLKAVDGETAVEMAQSQFPDLIFLDIVLPGISGFAVLRALRRHAHTRTTPIIMMTGNQQATEQFYVQRFGADGFVRKPFGREDIFRTVHALVDAGRMPARHDRARRGAIPEGMTPDEWNAIPDVGMPDEAQAARDHPGAARGRRGPGAGPKAPSTDGAITVAVPIEPPHLDDTGSAGNARQRLAVGLGGATAVGTRGGEPTVAGRASD